MRKSLWAAALIGVVALAVIPAFAAEGKTPIWEPLTIGPGAGSGKYIVTRDILTPAGAGAAIFVAGGPGVEHVDIDLNGFTVFGDPAGSPAVIEVGGGLRSFTLRNGEVRNLGPFGDCVRVSISGKLVVEDVKTSDGDTGLALEGVGSFALRRNIISRAGVNGIFADGSPLATPMTGVIEQNVIREAVDNGIFIIDNHSGIIVRNNNVESPSGGFGIFIRGGGNFLVAENTIERAGADGLFVEAANASKLYNNVISSSGGNGMTLIGLGGFLVLDNVVSGNSGDGIFLDGFLSHLDRNVTNFNGRLGMHFSAGSADNTYGRNTSRGNGGAPCAFVAPIEPCAGIGGGGGSFPPNFCNESPTGNTSRCDNLMPGPPLS